MMDRRALLKRLGLVGLAIPTAMALETKLVLPDAERTKAAEVVKQGVVDIDPKDVLLQDFRVDREQQVARWEGSRPVLYPERLRVMWTMFGDRVSFDLGKMVRIHYGGQSAIVAIVRSTYWAERKYSYSPVVEFEGEGVWAR